MPKLPKIISIVAIASVSLTGCAYSLSDGVVKTTENKKESSASKPQEPVAPQKKYKDSVLQSKFCGESDCVSLLFTGDFLMHDYLWAQARRDAATTGKTPMDFLPLIEAQRAYVAQADLAVCQMETPVAEPDGPYGEYPMFNVPPQIISAAKDIGWDACMTASNHTIDAGTAGLERTYKTLEQNGLGVTGSNLTAEEAQQPDIFTAANGVKVAVVTGTYGLNGLVPDFEWQADRLDAPTMIAKAKKAREQGADIVIANMHAGDEYVHEPNVQQVEVGHQLADSGEFDMIVGEHAHAVQPIEKYKDTWIVYGMGNNLTELSPTYEANNEGIMVNPILVMQKDGSWKVDQLRWAASRIVDSPAYRYCITTPGGRSADCISEPAAEASYQRVKQVVESMGAVQQGLIEWQL